MKKIKNAEMAHAWSVAGWRERYAMEHGNRATIYQDGEKCYKFTYSTANEYQDEIGDEFTTGAEV